MDAIDKYLTEAKPKPNPVARKLKKDSQKVIADATLRVRKLKMDIEKFDNTLGGTTLFDRAEMKLDEAMGALQMAYDEIAMGVEEAEYEMAQ